MAKVTLTTISNIGGNPASAQNNINSNFAAIAAYLEETLSRNGLTPNEMDTTVDMNSNQVINVGAPTSDNSAARLIDITAAVGGGAYEDISVTFDGGASVLSTGDTHTYWTAPYSGVIVAWYLVGYPSGSVVIDVWKRAGAIPTVANTIAGTEKPTVSSGQINSDVALTTWSTGVAVGDIFDFNIDSVTAMTKAVLTLKVRKT
jgi:hypothetical protein